MKNRSPAFQFYASDYLADEKVQLMTLEQEGAYIRLLAYCWREGTLPADPESLAKLCKGCSTDVITVVERLFQQDSNDPTRLVHKRLEEERAKQKAYHEQQSNAGKKSAENRSKVHKTSTSVPTDVERAFNENPSLQSSSSSSSSSKLAGPALIDPSIKETLKDSAGEAPAVALEIYRHFPVHMNDAKALAAIQEALNDVDGLVLLAAVKKYAAEVKDTNTQSPTWPVKWFSEKHWQIYQPVEATQETVTEPSTPAADDDQNFSPFPPDFYTRLGAGTDSKP